MYQYTPQKSYLISDSTQECQGSLQVMENVKSYEIRVWVVENGIDCRK